MDFIKEVTENGEDLIHHSIISKLLKGVWLGPNFEKEYFFLMQNEEWYRLFFRTTFRVNMKKTEGIYRLLSPNTKSVFMSQMNTRMAILFYEINTKGHSVSNTLKEKEFTLKSINDLLLGSVQFQAMAKKLKFDNKLISKLKKINILHKIDDHKFRFDSYAIDVFMNTFEELKENFPNFKDEDEEDEVA